MASINDEHAAGYRATHPGFHFEQSAPTVTGGTAVSRAHKRIENSVKGLKAHAEYIDTRTDLGPEEKRLAVQAYANTAAGRDAVEAVKEVEQRRDQAAARIEAERAKLTPHLDAAGEMRLGREVDRVNRKLGSTDDAHAVTAAREVLQAASQADLGTVAREVVANLENRGVPADWVDSVVAQAVPDLAAATAERDALDQALSVTKANADMARRGIESGHVPTHFVDPSRWDIDADK